MERFYKQFGDEKVFSLEYDKQTLVDLCCEYQERIDKAIEYITSRSIKAGVELMPREKELLEILKGEDNE